MNWKYGLLIAALVFAFGMVCADIAIGDTEAMKGEVVGRYYQPPRTDIETYTDIDGNVHIRNVYRGARYTVAVDIGTEVLEIRTRRDWFYAVEDGDFVDVCVRRGSVLGLRWLSRICDGERP